MQYEDGQRFRVEWMVLNIPAEHNNIADREPSGPLLGTTTAYIITCHTRAEIASLTLDWKEKKKKKEKKNQFPSHILLHIFKTFFGMTLFFLDQVKIQSTAEEKV